MLVSTIQQTESLACVHIPPLFYTFFLSRSPESTRQSSLCYTIRSNQHLFYMQQCTYVNHNLLIHPTSFSPPGIHKFAFYICVYIFALQISSSIPFFLDFTYKCTCFSHAQLFVTLWVVAHQAPLSKGFSRQEYWSELPCPPPRDLLNPGIKPKSLMSPVLAGGFFTTTAAQEAHLSLSTTQ